jgi:hypothetical protein
VINQDGSGRGRRGGRRIVPLVALTAIAGAVFFASAGPAAAGSTALCTGEVAPLNKKKPGVDAELSFTCSEDIRGFSVTTNKRFDFFGTELDVFLPDGSGSPESATIQCSGNVPGPGFGCGVVNRDVPSGCGAVTGPTANQVIGPPCTQRVSAGNRSAMQVGFPVNPCKPAGLFAPGKEKLQIWLSVLTEPLVGAFNATAINQTAYTRGTYISEPFRLKVKGYSNCAPKAKKSAKAKGKKASGTGSWDLGRILSWF